MKKVILGFLLGAIGLCAHAATLNPVQLLNPAGSTSGQAIISTGASTAPAWGNVPVANVTGAAALTGATFTGDLTVSEPSAALIMNDTSGSGFPQFVYRSSGVNEWIVFDAPSTHKFTVNRYVGGVFQDAPLTISNSSGVVTMTDGITASPITASPISGSTGSFTTLAASSTVSGAGFTTLLSPYAPLASPTFTGTVTAAALTATGAITPSQTAGVVGTTTNNSANAGSVGEFICAQVTNGGSPVGCASNSSTPVSITPNANIASISLTAGDWDVFGNCAFIPAGSTVVTFDACSISLTSATLDSAAWALGPGLPTGNVTAVGLTAPTRRELLSSTTTVYLVGQGSFTTSTMTAYGFIGARRRR